MAKGWKSGGKVAIEPKIRFERQYIPEPNSGCWLWFGCQGSQGYGSFHMPGNHACKAHRASWMIYRGAIPDGLQVLHKCDNPSCVNPDHLFLGTNFDNMRDRHAKGRYDGSHSWGEKNNKAKLTADLIPIIRASDENGPTLGARYGVTKDIINRIKSRKIWRHVA